MDIVATAVSVKHTVNVPQLFATVGSIVVTLTAIATFLALVPRWARAWVNRIIGDQVPKSPAITDLTEAIRDLAESSKTTQRELARSLGTLAMSVARMEGGNAARDDRDELRREWDGKNRRGESTPSGD